ncbi:MAG: methylated-DNA--[protein]-cysteine S-methyltransferase [Flavobacteriaceae bacterium]|nr:methylated-DNA--[protein]-cysteine S-methyltransferase [Flavobacteriaceae bacterium]
MESNITAYCKTPIGTAKFIANAFGLQSVSISDKDYTNVSHQIPEALKEPVAQLRAYFENDLKQFNLKLNPVGTDFQKKVWQVLQEIPYGKTITYLEQSKRYGDAMAIRAIAHANAVNPLWVIVPCHRVIGSDGSLTGYAGGLWRKKWLLDFESGCQQTSLF